MPAYELKLAVTSIRARRLLFGLYKGTEAQQVLITTQAPKPDQIKSVEAEIGEAKRIAKGVCMWENEKLTFATRAEPSPLWETAITKIFKANQCAKFLPVVVRQLREDEAEDAKLDTEAEPEAPAGETVPTPPVTPPPPPETPGDALAARYAELRELVTPLLKPALAKNPANQAELVRLAGEGAGFGKTSQFSEGIAAFEKLLTLLQAPPALPAAPATADPLAALLARLKLLKPDLDRALKVNDEGAGELKKLVAEVSALAKAKEFETANAKLDQVEQLLKGVPSAPPSPPVQTAPQPEGRPTRGRRVNFAKARLQWGSAKQTVAGQLSRLRGTILEEFPEAAAEVQRLDEILAQFSEGLGDTLDALYNAEEGPAKDQSRQSALTITDSYLDFLLTSPLVEHVDEHPFENVSVAVRETLSPSLREIRQMLAA